MWSEFVVSTTYDTLILSGEEDIESGYFARVENLLGGTARADNLENDSYLRIWGFTLGTLGTQRFLPTVSKVTRVDSHSDRTPGGGSLLVQ